MYKVGDIVVCINPSPILNLKKGEVYTITKIYDSQIGLYLAVDCKHISSGEIFQGIYGKRFKLSPEHKVKKLLNKLYDDK